MFTEVITVMVNAGGAGHRTPHPRRLSGAPAHPRRDAFGPERSSR
jgi:hypothetical protein